jgi:hypothetical protein
MDSKQSSKSCLNTLMIILALVATVSFSLVPDLSFARRGGDEDRVRYYGIIESKPTQGLHGDWVIGGRTVTTSPGTEFDQSEGALAIGGCAKVDFRNGRVHEIDTEPMRDCK